MGRKGGISFLSEISKSVKNERLDKNIIEMRERERNKHTNTYRMR